MTDDNARAKSNDLENEFDGVSSAKEENEVHLVGSNSLIHVFSDSAVSSSPRNHCAEILQSHELNNVLAHNNALLLCCNSDLLILEKGNCD